MTLYYISDMYPKEIFLNVMKRNGIEHLILTSKACIKCAMHFCQRLFSRKI